MASDCQQDGALSRDVSLDMPQSIPGNQQGQTSDLNQVTSNNDQSNNQGQQSNYVADNQDVVGGAEINNVYQQYPQQQLQSLPFAPYFPPENVWAISQQSELALAKQRADKAAAGRRQSVVLKRKLKKQQQQQQQQILLGINSDIQQRQNDSGGAAEGEGHSLDDDALQKAVDNATDEKEAKRLKSWYSQNQRMLDYYSSFRKQQKQIESQFQLIITIWLARAWLLRNRVSAQQARERRKVYVQDLEQRTKQQEAKINDLQSRLDQLTAENSNLKQQLQTLQQYQQQHIFQHQHQQSQQQLGQNLQPQSFSQPQQPETLDDHGFMSDMLQPFDDELIVENTTF